MPYCREELQMDEGGPPSAKRLHLEEKGCNGELKETQLLGSVSAIPEPLEDYTKIGCQLPQPKLAKVSSDGD